MGTREAKAAGRRFHFTPGQYPKRGARGDIANSIRRRA